MLALLTWSLAGCAKPAAGPPNVAEADIPLHLPAAEAFTFGPGDVIRIWVWRHDDLTQEIPIAPDGCIAYPLVGRVKVAGLTYEQLATTLRDAIAGYYVDPQVQVNIVSISNQKVLVMGEVTQPQVIQITNELSLLEALVRSGGINPEARTSNVLIIRGGVASNNAFTVDVNRILASGDLSQMVYLQRGDIVYVPPTTITNVERFFRHIQAVLAPAVGASAVYRNFLGSGAQGTSSALGD